MWVESVWEDLLSDVREVMCGLMCGLERASQGSEGMGAGQLRLLVQVQCT